MPLLSPVRRMLKRIHPEGIPWPATLLYNAVSRSSVFQQHYVFVAQDIAAHIQEGRVLDVGTGPGWLLLAIRAQSRDLELVGIDISPAMVHQAHENIGAAGLANHIEVREGGAANIPFPESSFDLVVSTGSLHHWTDAEGGLNEIYRVLKPGGTALIYDVVTNTPKAAMTEAAKQFGRLKVLLFWLHGFEEPFMSSHALETLAKETRFGEGVTRFAGVLCCLKLLKPA
ncbi:MAG: class I SAM-dependent methyltransferase [Candidatus Hydrogenedentes bacterium]|nr:class I SAM-dependent methyltransferase [Candidatus Hydrogenedentota bacterium]